MPDGTAISGDYHAQVQGFVADILDARLADCLPGQRMVAGKPYTFNAELLLDHVAREAVANAPANLSGLDEEQLTGLRFKALRVAHKDRGERVYGGAGEVLLSRITGEFARREAGQ